MQNFEMNINKMNFKLNRLEQYSRKSSICVYGIEESEAEKVGEKVIGKIKEEIGLDINAEEIDIVHRAGRKLPGQPRGILVKFVNVMRRQKNATGVKIGEDLAYGTKKMLNESHRKKQEINVEKAWTIDGRIKYKLVNIDRVNKIRLAEDFVKLVSSNNSNNMEQ